MIKHSEAEVGTAPSDQVVAILGEIAERSRKLVEDFVARQRRPATARDDGLDGHSPLGGTFIEMLTRVMSQPQRAGAGAVRAVAGLCAALAEHDPAHARRRGRAGDRARPRRPAVQGRGLERQRAVRLHQAVLPAELEILPAGRRPEGRAERQDPAEARVLHPPVRRDDGALELRRDQSRGAAADPRDPRREPAARPQQHAGGPRARQGPARDQDDRSRRVRGRPATSRPRRARSCSRPT